MYAENGANQAEQKGKTNTKKDGSAKSNIQGREGAPDKSSDSDCDQSYQCINCEPAEIPAYQVVDETYQQVFFGWGGFLKSRQ